MFTACRVWRFLAIPTFLASAVPVGAAEQKTPAPIPTPTSPPTAVIPLAEVAGRAATVLNLLPTLVFSHPFAAALMFPLYYISSPYSAIPVSLRQLCEVLVLAPVIRLTQPAVDPRLTSGLCTLAVLVALDAIRHLVPLPPEGGLADPGRAGSLRSSDRRGFHDSGQAAGVRRARVESPLVDHTHLTPNGGDVACEQ
jgi:hypothetical protein